MPKSETVVKIDSPADLIAALPHMLGYVPVGSLVLVCMQGAKQRTGLVLRYDLWATERPEAFLERAMERIEAEAPSGLLAIVWGGKLDEDDDEWEPFEGPELPCAPFVELLLDELDQLGIPDRDVLYTEERRWWSYLCNDFRCCPPEGTPVAYGSEADLLLAAEHAYAGTSVLPNRRSLVRSFGYSDDGNLKRRRAACKKAIARSAGLSPESARRVAHRMVLEILERCADPREVLTEDQVADLVGIVEHLWGRDEFLIHGIDPDERDILIRVMSDLVRRVPPPYDAPVCAILAWLTYARGDGTIANIAVDRVVATNPEYSLADLIRTGLEQQISPKLIQEAMIGAADDLHGRDTGG